MLTFDSKHSDSTKHSDGRTGCGRGGSSRSGRSPAGRCAAASELTRSRDAARSSSASRSAACAAPTCTSPRATSPPRRPRVVPGHEIVGIVEQRGPGTSRFDVGQRVGIAWLRHTCGACRFCRRGDENLCVSPAFTGWDADGGYAELAVVDENYAYPIPDIFGDAEAAPLLCAGIIGYRALRRAALPPGGRLGIYGFGASAHLAAQVALHEGATVHVLTRSADARRLALGLGATSAGDAADAPPEPLDAAILFAPAGDLVPVALRALDRGGTLAVAGIHLSDIPPLRYATDLFEERQLRSVTANTRSDGEAVSRHRRRDPAAPDRLDVPVRRCRPSPRRPRRRPGHRRRGHRRRRLKPAEHRAGRAGIAHPGQSLAPESLIRFIRQLATANDNGGHDGQPDDGVPTLRDAVAHESVRRVVEQADEDRPRLPRRRDLGDPGEGGAEQSLDEEHDRQRPHRGALGDAADGDEQGDVGDGADGRGDERRAGARRRAGDEGGEQRSPGRS